MPQPSSTSTPVTAPSIPADHADGWTHRIGRWLLTEVKRILGIFAYLWVVFGLLILHEHIVLSRHGMGYGFYGLAFINAWILAKVMLVGESLDILPIFRGRPLIFPILARSFVFAALLVCAYAIEEMAFGLWHGKTLAGSVPAIGGGGARGVASVGLIMAVALIPYFAFRELGRVLGRERLRTILFQDGAAITLPDQETPSVP
ncbi:hypothetical protein [Methylorubrum extorquens]|uniref:Uncharacterized protein n=1 Tax=Methylorubrum extorquens (strain CM4 / NCIMB 13688) TaxID=440085 RepID=B7KZX4_METC4|nr:hypothetical protein [Methylorubrum extorquens]ACK84905.1 conserved hypothetical protein [Methylorubrum extorquens CM4]